MVIRVLNDRSIVKDADPYGTQNENQVTTLNFVIPEEYASFNKKIVFITPNGVYWDLITNDTYIIKNNVTKYRNVSAYVWLVDVENQIDFRTKIFYIDFNQNTNPDNYIPSSEEISGYDTMIAELNDALDEIEALNPINKEIVQTLPTQDINPDTIYFVPKTTPATNYAYDKYMYINNAWENMDGASADMSNFYNKTESDNRYVQKTDIVSSVSSSSTNSQVPGAKLFYDTIGDINTMLDEINRRNYIRR